MSQGLGKAVVLWLMAEYNDSYVPQTESGVLSKPLTDLHDPRAMELTFLPNMSIFMGLYLSN